MKIPAEVDECERFAVEDIESKDWLYRTLLSCGTLLEEALQYYSIFITTLIDSTLLSIE